MPGRWDRLLSICEACRIRAGGGERGMAAAIVAVGPLLAITMLVTVVALAREDALQAGARERLERPLGVRGVVLAEADETGLQLGRLMLRLGTLSGPDGVSLAPYGNAGELVVTYRDEDEFVPAVPYAVEWLSGDGDSLLEPGEVALLTVSLEDGVATTLAGERWTLDVLYGANGELSVSRRLPTVLQPITPLD